MVGEAISTADQRLLDVSELVEARRAYQASVTTLDTARSGWNMFNLSARTRAKAAADAARATYESALRKANPSLSAEAITSEMKTAVTEARATRNPTQSDVVDAQQERDALKRVTGLDEATVQRALSLRQITPSLTRTHAMLFDLYAQEEVFRYEGMSKPPELLAESRNKFVAELEAAYDLSPERANVLADRVISEGRAYGLEAVRTGQYWRNGAGTFTLGNPEVSGSLAEAQAGLIRARTAALEGLMLSEIRPVEAGIIRPVETVLSAGDAGRSGAPAESADILVRDIQIGKVSTLFIDATDSPAEIRQLLEARSTRFGYLLRTIVVQPGADGIIPEATLREVLADSSKLNGATVSIEEGRLTPAGAAMMQEAEATRNIKISVRTSALPVDGAGPTIADDARGEGERFAPTQAERGAVVDDIRNLTVDNAPVVDSTEFLRKGPTPELARLQSEYFSRMALQSSGEARGLTVHNYAEVSYLRRELIEELRGEYKFTTQRANAYADRLELAANEYGRANVDRYPVDADGWVLDGDAETQRVAQQSSVDMISEELRNETARTTGNNLRGEGERFAPTEPERGAVVDDIRNLTVDDARAGGSAADAARTASFEEFFRPAGTATGEPLDLAPETVNRVGSAFDRLTAVVNGADAAPATDPWQRIIPEGEVARLRAEAEAIIRRGGSMDELARLFQVPSEDLARVTAEMTTAVGDERLVSPETETRVRAQLAQLVTPDSLRLRGNLTQIVDLAIQGDEARRMNEMMSGDPTRQVSSRDIYTRAEAAIDRMNVPQAEKIKLHEWLIKTGDALMDFDRPTAEQMRDFRTRAVTDMMVRMGTDVTTAEMTGMIEPMRSPAQIAELRAVSQTLALARGRAFPGIALTSADLLHWDVSNAFRTLDPNREMWLAADIADGIGGERVLSPDGSLWNEAPAEPTARPQPAPDRITWNADAALNSDGLIPLPEATAAPAPRVEPRFPSSVPASVRQDILADVRATNAADVRTPGEMIAAGNANARVGIATMDARAARAIAAATTTPDLGQLLTNDGRILADGPGLGAELERLDIGARTPAIAPVADASVRPTAPAEPVRPAAPAEPVRYQEPPTPARRAEVRSQFNAADRVDARSPGERVVAANASARTGMAQLALTDGDIRAVRVSTAPGRLAPIPPERALVRVEGGRAVAPGPQLAGPATPSPAERAIRAHDALFTSAANGAKGAALKQQIDRYVEVLRDVYVSPDNQRFDQLPPSRQEFLNTQFEFAAQRVKGAGIIAGSSKEIKKLTGTARAEAIHDRAVASHSIGDHFQGLEESSKAEIGRTSRVTEARAAEARGEAGRRGAVVPFEGGEGRGGRAATVLGITAAVVVATGALASDTLAPGTRRAAGTPAAPGGAAPAAGAAAQPPLPKNGNARSLALGEVQRSLNAEPGRVSGVLANIHAPYTEATFRGLAYTADQMRAAATRAVKPEDKNRFNQEARAYDAAIVVLKDEQRIAAAQRTATGATIPSMASLPGGVDKFQKDAIAAAYALPRSISLTTSDGKPVDARALAQKEISDGLAANGIRVDQRTIAALLNGVQPPYNDDTFARLAATGTTPAKRMAAGAAIATLRYEMKIEEAQGTARTMEALTPQRTQAYVIASSKLGADAYNAGAGRDADAPAGAPAAAAPAAGAPAAGAPAAGAPAAAAPAAAAPAAGAPAAGAPAAAAPAAGAPAAAAPAAGAPAAGAPAAGTPAPGDATTQPPAAPGGAATPAPSGSDGMTGRAIGANGFTIDSADDTLFRIASDPAQADALRIVKETLGDGATDHDAKLALALLLARKSGLSSVDVFSVGDVIKMPDEAELRAGAEVIKGGIFANTTVQGENKINWRSEIKGSTIANIFVGVPVTIAPPDSSTGDASLPDDAAAAGNTSQAPAGGTAAPAAAPTGPAPDGSGPIFGDVPTQTLPDSVVGGEDARPTGEAPYTPPVDASLAGLDPQRQ